MALERDVIWVTVAQFFRLASGVRSGVKVHQAWRGFDLRPTEARSAHEISDPHLPDHLHDSLPLSWVTPSRFPHDHPKWQHAIRSSLVSCFVEDPGIHLSARTIAKSRAAKACRRRAAHWDKTRRVLQGGNRSCNCIGHPSHRQSEWR